MGFAIKDGHFRVDSRLVGHWVWREIQIQIPGFDDSNYFHQRGYFLALLTLYLMISDLFCPLWVRSDKKLPP